MADEKSTGTPILFKVGGTAVSAETECSLQVNGAEIDMSNKSTQYWKEFLAGRADWNASGGAMLMFDSTAHTLEASQKALWTAMSTRADVEVEIALTATLTLSGTAFLTSLELNATDDSPATYSWSVRGKDALVLTEGE